MKRIKKVLILYTANIDNSKPFFDLTIKDDMEKLFAEGKEAGIKFYRALPFWFDLNKKHFEKAWSLKKGKWKIVNSIKPDIVFDKCKYTQELGIIKNQIASAFKFVNDPLFDEITSNKFITYCFFSDFMAKSYLVRNTNDLNKKIDSLKCNKLVLKPVIGSKGRGIRILTRSKIKNIKVEETSLLQEFIDSSNGIKNIVNSTHDLRIVVFNNKVFGAYIRVPKKGCLLANIAQGGRRIIIKKKDIPPIVVKIVKKIILRFNNFGNLFYSADFIFDKRQKPYLIEINSRPAFSIGDEYSRKFFNNYYKKIINYFLGI